MWKLLKKISVLEIILFVIFFIYLVLNVEMPSEINKYIDTPLGVVVVLVLTLLVFIYTNPVLGILSIFVAYEIVRRSSNILPKMTPAPIIYNPIQIPVKNPDIPVSKTNSNDIKENAILPKGEHTIEEDVVSKMAPISMSISNNYIDTGFRPISESIHNAASLH